MASETIARRLFLRIYALIEAGFDVMARYPFDLGDLHWSPELYEGPPEERGSSGDSRRRPSGRGGGPCRAIKVVPPPASRRYWAARPTRIPARPPHRKQTV